MSVHGDASYSTESVRSALQCVSNFHSDCARALGGKRAPAREVELRKRIERKARQGGGDEGQSAAQR